MGVVVQRLRENLVSVEIAVIDTQPTASLALIFQGSWSVCNEEVNRLQQTALYEQHEALNAKIVDFAGWAMPIQYPSGILFEARGVRNGTGIFDVSHMGRLRFVGGGAELLLDKILTRNILSLREGRARYGFLCNENGGIIDDVVVSRISSDEFSLVCNAGNRPKVIEWIENWTEGFGNVEITDLTNRTGMIAIQGPTAADVVVEALSIDLKDLGKFRVQQYAYADTLVTFSRTGYTGEDGFEVICNAVDASRLWSDLVDHGAIPAGLGSRDNLRLEAALALHGSDIDESTNPIEAGLSRFVDFDKKFFVGKEALDLILEEGTERTFVGIELTERGIPRSGCALLQDGEQVGIVTSGGYGANIERSIGLAYVRSEFSNLEQELAVDIRGQLITAKIVRLPFYQR